MATLIAVVHHFGAAVTTWDLVPGLAAAGLGLGAVIAPLADIVLAHVPQREAGSASGVFNTGLQLGNSIGIALIGVIFFALLGSQSAAAARTVTPQLRSGLVAAGVPAQYTGRVVTEFGACLHARLVATDPTVTPGACHPAHGQVLPAAARPVLASTGGAALRTDFASSLVRTLWFQVGVFVLSFLLMLGIPAGAGKHARQTPPPAPGDRALAPAGTGRDGATA
jgi:hypothetical protein